MVVEQGADIELNCRAETPFVENSLGILNVPSFGNLQLKIVEQRHIPSRHYSRHPRTRAHAGMCHHAVHRSRRSCSGNA
eukprot:COSAG02_NODE_7114_length_3178_cov_2.066255_2_plen_79_part_00